MNFIISALPGISIKKINGNRMKKILFLAMTMAALQTKAQLLVNLQLPPNGVAQKSQLWNVTVTNTGTAVVSLHIELMLSDAFSSMQVLSAATQVISVAPGTMQLNNSVLQPIQYNVLSPAYIIDASPNGLLPVGDFEVCYSFISHSLHNEEKIAEECRELIIEPLSPPQLVYPYDQSAIETKNPQLSWLPPMPVNLFANLKYDLDLVELFPNQSPADAIQQNPALFHQQGIPAANLLYPTNAPVLELSKLYAWRVIAKSNEVPVGQSETWVFSVKEFNRVDNPLQPEMAFAKLEREDGGGYAIFSNELKFDYLNENSDSAWNLSVYDLSTSDKRKVELVMDSIKLKPGQNLVTCKVSANSDFIDKHLYLLEIINSRKESWRLRFEYRKPQE
jgi:hypothetical protein